MVNFLLSDTSMKFLTMEQNFSLNNIWDKILLKCFFHSKFNLSGRGQQLSVLQKFETPECEKRTNFAFVEF